MAQRNRGDRPGQRHHIYNRGLAKRVMFPDHRAKRRFLALLGCAVRRGEIRIESYTVLDTHYHLLARSTEVPIGYPMMRVQNAYSRYLNRRLRRDGPLPRGRFGSSPVDSLRYAITMVRYIDFNAVKARLASSPEAYRYGSAGIYLGRPHGPAWLDRSFVNRLVGGVGTSPTDPMARYRTLFGPRLTEGESEVVRRRMQGRAPSGDALDELFDMPPARIAAWMRRKAQLADGLQAWPPIVGSDAVLQAVKAAAPDLAESRVLLIQRRKPVLPILTAGLLHDVAGLSCEEVARTVGGAASTAGRRLKAHRALLAGSEEYGDWVGALLDAALGRTYRRGPRR